MKILGVILLVLGLIGGIIFGIQAAGDSETFNFLGLEIAVSSANWTPVIVSGVVALIGAIILMVRPKN
ncbi:MAG: hypothetical protein RBR87_04655 [Bacteroidales bacterium]|jgi:hypothetical protein|nr:hypothetical protein [Bacteroidales bacterium]